MGPFRPSILPWPSRLKCTEQWRVRYHVGFLLQLKNKLGPECFHNEADMPKKTHFCIDFDSPPKSTWNQGMWEVFWNDFVSIGYAQADEKDTVKKAYDAHIEYLRRPLLTGADKFAHNAQARKNKRLSQVSAVKNP